MPPPRFACCGTLPGSLLSRDSPYFPLRNARVRPSALPGKRPKCGWPPTGRGCCVPLDATPMLGFHSFFCGPPTTRKHSRLYAPRRPTPVVTQRRSIRLVFLGVPLHRVVVTYGDRRRGWRMQRLCRAFKGTVDIRRSRGVCRAVLGERKWTGQFRRRGHRTDHRLGAGRERLDMNDSTSAPPYAQQPTPRRAWKEPTTQMMIQCSTGPILCGFDERWQAETPEVHRAQRAQRQAMRALPGEGCDYLTFANLAKILVQIAQMPDGRNYMWVARIHVGGLHHRAAGVSLWSTGCRVCERDNCPQRAFPALGRALDLDEHRTVPPYLVRGP